MDLGPVKQNMIKNGIELISDRYIEEGLMHPNYMIHVELN